MAYPQSYNWKAIDPYIYFLQNRELLQLALKTFMVKF